MISGLRELIALTAEFKPFFTSSAKTCVAPVKPAGAAFISFTTK